MGYSISAGINKGDNEKLKGIASVIIDKSFKISNIAIFEGKKGLFVAMPRFKGKDKDGNEAYKDVCHPITAEFRKALYSDILKTFEEAMKTEEQFAKYESPDIQDSPKLKVSAFPVKEEENSKLRGFANIVFNDNFVVENIPIRENKEGKNFVAMPSYKSVHRQDYRDIVYPVTKEYQAELQQAVLAQFDKVKEMEVNPLENPFEEGTFDNRSIKRAEEILEGNENKEITIKFGKGLVGPEFQGKDGTSYRQISIPNADKDDHRPWQTFVVKATHVHDNKYSQGGPGMWVKLPAEGNTTLQRSVVVGETPDGKKEYNTEKTKISNADLKKLVEAYKEKDDVAQENPLASVEKLEEGNYNMIDGIPNNDFGEKKQADVDFKDVASNLNMTAADMEALSTHENVDVRRAVAAHENTPVSVLETLAKDEDHRVRFVVAMNENTPATALETLSKDENMVVRVAVAENENTPANVLVELAKDEDTPVAVLETLAKDENYQVRFAVAKNENTPANVLENLAKDEDYYVLWAVAENSNTPVHVLETFAKNENYLSAVAGNRNTPVAVLEELAKVQDAEYLVREAVARNENTPVNVLEDLSKDEDFIREIVAGNESTPATVLETLAKDEVMEVRWTVAENKNTPVAVLEDLAKDEYSYVSGAAQNNLDSRGLDKTHEKPVLSASDLRNAKAEKDVRDAAAPKQEQEQQKKTDLEI